MTIDIDKLAAQLVAATPGPWFQNLDEPRWIYCDKRFICGPGEQSDAELLVALRNAAPALIAEVRGLRDLYCRNASLIQSLDCRYTGAGVADLSGTHCPPDRPCQRCRTDAELERLRAIEAAARELMDLPDRDSMEWCDADEIDLTARRVALKAALAAKGEA